MLGNGYEYRQIDEYKQADCPVILPLNFPKKPEIKSHEDALDISLTDLRHWDGLNRIHPY
jgi:hypothetical protein